MVVVVVEVRTGHWVLKWQGPQRMVDLLVEVAGCLLQHRQPPWPGVGPGAGLGGGCTSRKFHTSGVPRRTAPLDTLLLLWLLLPLPDMPSPP